MTARSSRWGFLFADSKWRGLVRLVNCEHLCRREVRLEAARCVWLQAIGMAIEMVFGDGANGDAASLGKGIGNYFEALAIHSYVFGSGEAEVLDACTLVGTGVSRHGARASDGFFQYGL
jgi:hypothetical protein